MGARVASFDLTMCEAREIATNLIQLFQIAFDETNDACEIISAVARCDGIADALESLGIPYRHNGDTITVSDWTFDTQSLLKEEGI